MKPININSKGKKLYLEKGRYGVFILGGWGVSLNSFSITIKPINNERFINCKKAFLKTQSYAFGKRAKRIFIIDIPQSASYELVFNEPNTIRVKRSNLFIKSNFSNILSTESLEVLITKKLGFYPTLE